MAIILEYSRYQDLRMEKGETRFKDDQLDGLAFIYGEDVSTYKDMQDLDYLLREIGYNYNPGNAIHLLNLTLKAITIPSETHPSDDKISPEIKEKLFNLQSFSKEFQQQKIAEIMDNIRLRYQQNDLKMTEIREKIVPIADAPNTEKAKLWHQFHLLEDEQISIQKLIDKLRSLS